MAALRALEEAAAAQWRTAGGHALEARLSPLADESRASFVLLQTAALLDARAALAKASLQSINSAPAPPPPPRPRRAPHRDDDDESDGSALQGALVRRNVRRGKPELELCAGAHAAPDGSLRLLLPAVMGAEECEQLVAGGLVAMAGAFARCGQTTLGLSPALAHRMRPAAPPPHASPPHASPPHASPPHASPPHASPPHASPPHAYPLHASPLHASPPHASPPAASSPPAAAEPTLPLLYRTVERARRAVAAAFGEAAPTLRTSDATLTRLQPPAAAGAAAAVLDVGALRADRFVYSRPHLDQVSVAEYEYSALLYLVGHEGGGERGSFGGGRLLFHDEDADRVVLPRPGLLVAFRSGAPNLHSVEEVTHGSRFALTMWFTTLPQSADEAAAVDPVHAAMQRWAVEEAEALAHGRPPPPPPPPPPPLGCAGALPTREESILSAALCSLPANDRLCQALLRARASGAPLCDSLASGVGLPVEQAHCAPSCTDAEVEAALDSLRDEDFHPLLRGRVKTLRALTTTLHRAIAQRGGALDVGNGLGSAPVERVRGSDCKGTSDDFSLFDAAPCVRNDVDATDATRGSREDELDVLHKVERPTTEDPFAVFD
ncbi:hypothetical protein AB1Y20_014934 [Prymnesium parvum]|uniref:Fe2OG dioxygenase domain-containing protein n=1 Tax=Prymnesium parvum TaxID=97485 RepID=A0AB34JZ56_PRYPA